MNLEDLGATGGSMPSSKSPPGLLSSSARGLGDLDTNLNKQASARRERDMKLTTMDADIDTVMATMRATVKQTDHLQQCVTGLTQQLEEERSARRLLEKVLLKMAEEQTLQVVEKELHKEKLARDAANKKLKDYIDLVHTKLTTREKEAGAERRVQRAMIQVIAKTRRQLNRLHRQVQNNQGDLEERISTDIAHLNRRCKELQESIDHESLRATHETTGVENKLTDELVGLAKTCTDRFDGLDQALDRKTGQLTEDVSALDEDLAREKGERAAADEHGNAKMMEQVGKLQGHLEGEMHARTEENAARHKQVENSLQNVFMNLQQERQTRENDVGTLQTAVYDEASVRHTENTALSELVEQLVTKVQTGMHTEKLPLKTAGYVSAR